MGAKWKQVLVGADALIHDDFPRESTQDHQRSNCLYIVVYAKTSPEKHSRGECWVSHPLGSRLPSSSIGITAFIIEKEFTGFSTHQKLDKFGVRCNEY